MGEFVLHHGEQHSLWTWSVLKWSLEIKKYWCCNKFYNRTIIDKTRIHKWTIVFYHYLTKTIWIHVTPHCNLTGSFATNSKSAFLCHFVNVIVSRFRSLVPCVSPAAARGSTGSCSLVQLPRGAEHSQTHRGGEASSSTSSILKF